MFSAISNRKSDHPYLAAACASVAAGESPPEALVDWLQERGADLPGVLRLYAGTAAQGHTDGLPQSVLAAWCVATGDAGRGAQVAAVTDDSEVYIRHLERSLDVDEEYRDYLVRWEARRRPVDVPTDLPFVVRARAVAAAATTRDRKRRVLGLFGEVRYRDQRFLSQQECQHFRAGSFEAFQRVLDEMGLPRSDHVERLRLWSAAARLHPPRLTDGTGECWSALTLRDPPAVRVRHDYRPVHLIPDEALLEMPS